MNKDLEELKEVFLTEVDEDTRAENEQQIQEWETALIQNEAFASWRDHDVTREIAQKAKDTYKGACMQLMENRDLTDKQRESLFARQDAALWLISMIEVDAKGKIEQIQSDIRHALASTN